MPLLAGDVSLHCASPEASRQILSDMGRFTKPKRVLSLESVLSFFVPWFHLLTTFISFLGPNVVASVGEQWRRHRKITAPAFDNQS